MLLFSLANLVKETHAMPRPSQPSLSANGQAACAASVNRFGFDPQDFPPQADGEPLRLLAVPALWTGADDKTAKLRWHIAIAGRVIVTDSAAPLRDGAAALLALGHPPDTHATVRFHGAAFDAFAPVSLGSAAHGAPASLLAGGWPRSGKKLSKPPVKPSAAPRVEAGPGETSDKCLTVLINISPSERVIRSTDDSQWIAQRRTGGDAPYPWRACVYFATAKGINRLPPHWRGPVLAAIRAAGRIIPTG